MTKRGNASRAQRGYQAAETVLFCIVIFASTIILMIVCTPREDIALNLLWICFALTFGFCTGVFLTPYTAMESSEFAKIGQIISTLATGYAVAKFDPLIDEFIANHVWTTEAIARIVSIVTSYLVALITVFVFRKYVFSFEEERPSGERIPRQRESESGKVS